MPPTCMGTAASLQIVGAEGRPAVSPAKAQCAAAEGPSSRFPALPDHMLVHRPVQRQVVKAQAQVNGPHGCHLLGLRSTTLTRQCRWRGTACTLCR